MSQVALLRLINQQLTETKFVKVKDLVSWMGAVQAQDYAMAKWAIGLRLPGCTDNAIEEAINNREIIRTHILRPTWHFVAADDIRWMMELTAPQIYKAMIPHNRQLGLNDALFKKTNKIIAKVLKNGEQLTREEIMSHINKAGIITNTISAAHIMMKAELDMIVCNGKRRGKQFTYALFDHQVPAVPAIKKEEALALLASKYFRSHGPATIKDFIWWSGLPALDAQRALQSVQQTLISFKTGTKEYWMDKSSSDIVVQNSSLYLLPPYDEFLVSYADKTASLAGTKKDMAALGNGIFKPVIVKDGKVIGTWRRNEKKEEVEVETVILLSSAKTMRRGLKDCINRYGRFLGKKTTLVV